MKKHYFFTLLLTLCLSVFSFGQTTLSAGDLVVIEMQGDDTDGFRFVPLIDLDQGTVIHFTDNGWTGSEIRSGEGTVTYTVPSGGVLAGTNIRYSVGDTGDFSTSSDINISSSGDQILVYQGDASSPTFIFAVAGNSNTWQTGSNDSNQTDLPTGLTDGVNAVAAGSGSGPEDEFDNVYYSGITTGTKTELLAAVANAGNWIGDNTPGYTPITFDFTVVPATSDPTLSFVTPAPNQVFPSTTTTVEVNFNIQNFTLSGDNGSDMSDGTGDGYILGTAVENGGAPSSINIFNGFIDYEELEPGDQVTLTAELVDNSGNSLSPAVIAMVSFSVEFPCDLEIGEITNTCNASTSGADTFNSSIAFTGGNTGVVYTITAVDGNDNPVGTIGGDNPDTDTTGTITVTGIPEGTDVTFKVVGGTGSTCDLSRTLFSPDCFSLPFLETFNDYTTNNSLISNFLWKDASTSDPANDIQVVVNNDGGGNLILGNFYGSNELPDPSGNMISLSGAGSDPYIGFETVTSGTVYASFLFHATDFTGVEDDDGGYFAVLSENNSFRGRLWVRDITADSTDEGLAFNLGISTTSGTSSTLHTGYTVNLLEPVFVVIGYNLDNDNFMLWVAPDASTFGTNTPPTPDVTLTDGEADGINRFLFRQDSSFETPAMDVEDLRVGTTWTDVTSNPTASVGDNPIEGFAAFPNPVLNKRLTITSQSSDDKQVILYNILGKQVFSQNISGTRETVELNTLRSGLYILKVIEGSKVSTSKLVIE